MKSLQTNAKWIGPKITQETGDTNWGQYSGVLVEKPVQYTVAPSSTATQLDIYGSGVVGEEIAVVAGASRALGVLGSSVGSVPASGIDTATYASLSKLVTAQDTSPYEIAFSSDGTKMFILGQTNDTVYQYTLSTAWNVSTATYASLSKSVLAQDNSPLGLAFRSDGTKMFIVGAANGTIFQYTLSTAWNVSTATYASLSKSVSAQDSVPRGLAFSSDGTKMFIVGNTNKTVYQYTLSTPWNVSTATYASLSKLVSAQDADPRGLAFSSDGTKMFIVGNTNKRVYQYTLSTPWNVSTAVYASLSKLVSAQDTNPFSLTFSPDGTKMFIVGNINETVYQYSCNILGSASYDISALALPSAPTKVFKNPSDLYISFEGTENRTRCQSKFMEFISGSTTNMITKDFVSGTLKTGDSVELLTSTIATATYASLSKSVQAQDTNPLGLAFSPDGTKMFIMGNTSDTVYQYTLSTPWNVSTATYASLSKLVSAQETSPTSLAFSSDGTKMFINGNTNKTVFQYTLSTAWNVSTAVYASLSKSVAAQDSVPYGLAFSTDGTKMFIVGTTNDTVYQYTLSTPWNVSTATYASMSKLVSAQETSPTSLAFSTDGTKMFIVGTTNDTVYQYTLSTPWNVSTATYASLSKSVTAEETSPWGLAFSSDGTKMFINGNTNDTVYQYTCNINAVAPVRTVTVSESVVPASGINTSTYASLSKSVAAQDSVPYGLAFSTDGTKMFIVGTTNDTVYQYTLSTPWNVSTATYASLSKLVSAQETSPTSLAFSTDGTKMFIVGAANGTIFQYTLSTPWNVSTATYASLSKSVQAQDTNPLGLAFSPDGTKMFIMGNTSDTVYQYTLSTPWNVSTATYASLSKSVSAQDTDPYGLAFSSDGTKMFINGNTNKTVFQYTLSTAWNVSTAVYASLSKLVSSQETQPIGLAFSPDGTKMFIVGNTNDTVYQYTCNINQQVTYTSTFDAIPSTPYGVLLQDLSVKQVKTSFTESSDVLTIQHAPITGNARTIQHKVIGDTDNEVTQVQTNLWKLL